MKWIAFILLLTFNQTSSEPFASRLEYIGIAIEEPGYTVWGSSPVIDEQGKVHLFAARWPGTKVEPGWRTESEIAHYVADKPEGPFVFSDIALQGTGTDSWDSESVHNPLIQKVDEQYVLLYIGNNNGSTPPHPSNQYIGMAISDSPYGPWEKVGNDGLILKTPTGKDYWNYKARNGVNNPAFIKHPNGGYFLYFKSEKAKMGLAVAENLKGPYVQLPEPVTRNNKTIEDGYAFVYKGKICLLTTDNHGIIESGGGLLWTSDDGLVFEKPEQGFYPAIKYFKRGTLDKATKHYSAPFPKFERPQLLIIDGEPKFMYAPSGHHLFGGEAPVSYVFKVNPEK